MSVEPTADRASWLLISISFHRYVAQLEEKIGV